MNEFDVLGIAASGMKTEHSALEVAARNVAAMQTASLTHPIRPLEPIFAVNEPFTASGSDFMLDVDLARMRRLSTSNNSPIGSNDAPTTSDPVGSFATSEFGAGWESAVQMVGTKTGPPRSSVDAVTEMVDVLEAQRAYEFDASVFDAGKRLIQRTIDVGRF